MDSITFMIPAMTDDDVELVRTELASIPGVRTVGVHRPTRSVTITWGEPAGLEVFWKRLEALRLTPDFPQPF